MNYADIDFDMSPRRGEMSPLKKHPNYLRGDSKDSLRVNMGTRASGIYHNEGEGDLMQ